VKPARIAKSLRVKPTRADLERGEELRRAVWQSPEDRGALAVYADWLLEHGDATRAEYMQLALLDAPTGAQEKRQETLRKKHRGEWLGPARPFVYTWEESEDSPGFVAKVQCGVAKLAAGLEHIRALGPRLTVQVNPVTTARDRAALAKLSLGKLYGLALYESDLSWVSDRLLTAIAPKLHGLRRLELFFMTNQLSLETFRALLPELTIDELVIDSYFESCDPYIDALLASPLAKQLHVIELHQPNDPALTKRVQAAWGEQLLEFL
jgi:uncharacterized protein (TIGR02996 family)